MRRPGRAGLRCHVGGNMPVRKSEIKSTKLDADQAERLRADWLRSSPDGRGGAPLAETAWQLSLEVRDRWLRERLAMLYYAATLGDAHQIERLGRDLLGEHES